MDVDEVIFMQVASSALGVSEDIVSFALKVGSIPEWDSLGHIALVTSLENHFQVELSIKELLAIDNLQDIHNLIQMHLNSKR